MVTDTSPYFFASKLWQVNIETFFPFPFFFPFFRRMQRTSSFFSFELGFPY